MQWNVDTNTGNPTRSPLVLKLLKHIKRFEVQRRGKKLMKRRPLKAEEYEDTAIEKIYRVYGQSSTVTQVLNCIRQDNKRGGHPDLKVCHLWLIYSLIWFVLSNIFVQMPNVIVDIYLQINAQMHAFKLILYSRLHYTLLCLSPFLFVCFVLVLLVFWEERRRRGHRFVLKNFFTLVKSVG